LYTIKFEYIYLEDVEITSSTGIVLNTSDTTLYTIKFEYIYLQDVEITSSTGIVLNTSDTTVYTIVSEVFKTIPVDEVISTSSG
jgi:hypothetical protein